MTTATDIQLLEARLKGIDGLLAENEQRLSSAIPDSYAVQELASERRDLRQERGQVERRLEEARTGLRTGFYRIFAIGRHKPKPDPELVARDRLLEQRIAERVANVRRFADALEREGDYRQARLWRAEILNVRAQIQRELGLDERRFA